VNLWNYLGEQQKALSSNQFRRQCRVDFLNYLRVREWQDIYTQLRQVVKELGIPVNSEPAEYREIHIALLTGLLSHIGMKDAEKQEFTGARNARFSIFLAPVYSKTAEVDHGGRTGGNQPPVGAHCRPYRSGMG
jgi:ATP-dependent helicase HrpA